MMDIIQLRIAVAECAGYKWYRFATTAGGRFVLMLPSPMLGGTGGTECENPLRAPGEKPKPEQIDISSVPFFPTSLDAIHHVVMGLKGTGRIAFLKHLAEVCDKAQIAVGFAGAVPYCIAFLKVYGRYSEPEQPRIQPARRMPTPKQ